MAKDFEVLFLSVDEAHQLPNYTFEMRDVRIFGTIAEALAAREKFLSQKVKVMYNDADEILPAVWVVLAESNKYCERTFWVAGVYSHKIEAEEAVKTHRAIWETWTQ